MVTTTFRTEKNPGDIIADANERYLSVPYETSEYDTTEWATEKAKLGDVALYMDKRKELYKHFETLQNGSTLWFRYDITGEGKRTLRVSDPNRASNGTIQYDEIKDDTKKVTRDFAEARASVIVKYNYDVEGKASEQVEVTDYQTAVIEKYRTNKESEKDSLLTTEANALIKAEVIAEDQSEARPILTFTVEADSLSKITDKLYDIRSVVTSRPAGDEYAQTKIVTDEIYFDHEATDAIYFDHEATDTVYFDYPEFKLVDKSRTYWGTIRGQIIGITYNPMTQDYTRVLRERPESEVI